MYLAIGFNQEWCFSLARPVSTLDEQQIADFLATEAGLETNDALDVILVVQNGEGQTVPTVIREWLLGKDYHMRGDD